MPAYPAGMDGTPLKFFWRRVDGRRLTRQPLVVRSVAHGDLAPAVQEDCRLQTYAKLQWTVRGTASIRQGGRGRTVRAGDITWWPAGQEHWARAGEDGWECWWFTLLPESAAWPLLDVCGLSTAGTWPGGTCPQELFSELGRAAAGATAAAEEEAGALAYRLLAMAGRLRGDGPGGMAEAALAQINRRWCDADFSIAGLADSVGAHRSQLSRTFTRTVGTSPSDYLLHLRLSRAATLLRTTTLPVHLVAERCGFASASYFARSFRAAFDCPPGGYRVRSEV